MEQTITIVIPVRQNGSPIITLESLKKQNFKDYSVVVVNDEGKGANWARNKGFEQCKTEFVLFCDDDIEWERNGITALYETLVNSNVSYSYGSYEMSGLIQCTEEFDAEKLKRGNYISTMSLIRSNDFPGFDESLKRFQDWDLWLKMLSQGKIGKQCGELIFRTKPSGISSDDPTEDEKILKEKWKL